MAAGQGTINLKPNKPESYDGRRDFLVVNTWLYKVEQYLVLVQLSNPGVQLTEGNRILYASTFLTGTAAVWWYTLVQSKWPPTTWEQFKAKVVAEFVPEDHVRRARERLRKLRRTTSVAKYLSDFRNLCLTVPGMTDGEMWDKFCAGLKYEVGLEVMKSSVATFEEASKVALRVDSAIWGASIQSTEVEGGASSRKGSGPTPMEISIVESGGRQGRGPKLEGQLLTDYRNNACFTCHTVGCRPWKHQRGAAANNCEALGHSPVDETGTEEHSDDPEN